MRLLPAALAVTLLSATACTGAEVRGEGVTPPSLATSTPPPTMSTTTTSTTTTSTSTTTRPPTTTTVPSRLVTVATDLDVPWGLAFLPDGSALMTTRDQARLLQVRDGGRTTRLGTVPGVVPGGEGGLLGVAVSPRFATDRTIYLYLTAAEDNRVVRMRFGDSGPGATEPVLTGIAKAGNHNGGRIAFGPDGYLYVATGDAGDGEAAQDRRSLSGKILRVTPGGRPAPGNPFGDSPVWSYGHRNVQGLAWAPDGRMYASEFGQNTWDELNLIRPGSNYGWPVVEGRAGRSGFVDPLLQWSTSEASPSGIAVTADGTVWMAALRGQSLWRIPFSGNDPGRPQRLLHEEYGRLRDVVVGPDGRLWVLTNNTSRGAPREGDDRLLAIPVAALR